jgi:hypothetical protein
MLYGFNKCKRKKQKKKDMREIGFEWDEHRALTWPGTISLHLIFPTRLISN